MTITPEDERIRRNASGRARRASKKVMAAYSILYKPVEEWDMDELARGRPRSADGTFKGPSPKWITPAVKDEAKRRFQIMGRNMFSDHLASAIKVVSELAMDDSVDLDDKPTVPASVRLNAATYLIDQVLGKATARVEVEAGGSLRDLLAGSLVLPDGKPATVIEGEVVDAEDDDDEDLG